MSYFLTFKKLKHEKLSFLLALPFIFSLLSFSLPENKAGATPINYELELDIRGYYWNSCTGEYVYLEGTVYFDGHGAITEKRVNVQNHVRVFAEGVGVSTGIRYIIREKESFSSNFSFPGGSARFSYSDRLRLISQGSAPNQFLIFKAMFLVNANGEVTVNTGDFNIECR